MNPKRLYGAVAAAAVVVYFGALWNRFAFDDVTIVVLNPLVHQVSGIWRAFAHPYWPVSLIADLYRPLTIASFALDWLVGRPTWFHAVNLVWHAGASVAVAVLARRWVGDAAALLAGLVFAVHPVHVEAVATLVGRAELMAALFTLLAVYAALERGSVGWSTVAMAAGLLSKENAVVAPALIAWGWVAAVAPRPPRRQLVRFGAAWAILAAGYVGLRWAVLHRTAGYPVVAAVFMGQSPLAIRLTAIAALADVARLLLFPLHLSADYSPLERTPVTSLFDQRLGLGLLVVALWSLLLVLAWRRGRRLEAFGLGWIALAFLPVANLFFPTGVLLAERTLYLPSAGLALAVGGWSRHWRDRALALAAGVIVVAGGVRTALRVPSWRDSQTAALALLRDAPESYRAWDYLGWQYLWTGRDARALEAFRQAVARFDQDVRVFVAAGDAAYALGRPDLAARFVARADSLCNRCAPLYEIQAAAARQRGDTSSAAALEAHARELRASSAPH